MAQFFVTEQWDARWLADSEAFVAPFDGDHGRWDVVTQVRESERQLMVYSLCPLSVPAARVPAMGEFVARANFGLVLGNFELDWDAGDLRYKTSLDVGEGDVDEQLLRPLVYANVLMMDHYLSGVAAVIGGSNPADAIAHIELGDTSDQT